MYSLIPFVLESFLCNVSFTRRDDDEFRFNDASTHEGHLRQNGILTRVFNETSMLISHICIKCKTRTNFIKIKQLYFVKKD